MLPLARRNAVGFIALILLPLLLGCGATAANSDCEGCQSGETCLAGDVVDACGAGGEVCEVCAIGESCIDGQCTLPVCEDCEGCCDELGECLDGTDGFACGVGGVSCQTCAGECDRGQCVAQCGPSNCSGCCDSQGRCRYCANGDCPNGEQTDTECGAGGQACEDCSAYDQSCALVIVPDEQSGQSIDAGSCAANECSSCTDGCCLEVVGGGYACDPGDGTQVGCGGAGTLCDVCDEDEECLNENCVPGEDAAFAMVLVNAEVPDGPEGATFGFDSFSAPDVRVVVRVQHDPEIIGVDVDGPDNTREPDFGDETAVITTRARFQKGIFFDFIDRDSPDADDLMTTFPSTVYVPSDFTFSGGPLIVLSQGPYLIRYRFIKQ